MNMNRLTQKSLAAVQAAQDTAQEHGNQLLEQVHLLYALAKDAEGLIPQLLTAMGLSAQSFEDAARMEVEKLPKVSNYGREAGKVYIAQDVDAALRSAEQVAQSMKDEYVSVEHLFLGLIDQANATLKELFHVSNLVVPYNHRI